MSKYFAIVKKNFDNGFWNIDRVRDAVKKGWITEDEYQMITGEEYAQ